jgi:predicted ATPase/transcriptional regulator with XRE-family HTH domain
MHEQSSFGVLLKRYRLAAGLSQEALAARARLSTRAISDLERGIKHRPRFGTLELLTEALSLPAQQRALLQASARPEMAPAPAVPRPMSSISGLPSAPTPLIGRDQERSRALACLRSSSGRLLAITGPSGVGKTRLALQLVEDLSADFSDGVAFVALAPVRDAALVPEVLGQALHLHEQIGRPMTEQIRAFLQHKQLLLVLDNFEHLLEAVPFVADLLASCPRLHVLVTSRTPLHLRAEQVFPLPPLAQDAAVTLFRERAQAVRPGGVFDVAMVTAICERVDRLPLAIELAAMQVRVLSLPDLLERLAHRLTFLRGGARDLPARQQTMHDAIAWSYELLTASQQRCFRALSVFVGGWTLEAAEAVCWAEGEIPPDEAILTLAALVDASLVQVEMPTEGTTRFSMLELIREYALDRLCTAGEEEPCRRRHATYYACRGESVAPFGPGQGTGKTQLVLDFPNARAALQWAEEQQEATLGLRLASAFGEMWFSYGHMREAEVWLGRMLALDWQVGAPEALLVLRAEALSILADVLLGLGKLERAEALATEALERARQSGDQSCMSISWGILGMAAKAQGKLDEATAWFTESVSHARLTGHLSIDGIALRTRVELAWIQGDLALATTLAEEGRLRAQSEGINFVVAGNTNMLGHLAHQQGNYTLAKTRYQEALALYRTFGSPTYTAWCLEGFAAALCAEGHYSQATRLCATAATLREQARTPLPPAEREAFEQTVAMAKAALGGPAFAEEWNEGAALTQEQAIDYALSLDAQELGRKVHRLYLQTSLSTYGTLMNMEGDHLNAP